MQIKLFLWRLEEFSEKRKKQIRDSVDSLDYKSEIYYVSNLGDDNNDGKTPSSACKTLEKISSAPLQRDLCVLFKRRMYFEEV